MGNERERKEGEGKGGDRTASIKSLLRACYV